MPLLWVPLASVGRACGSTACRWFDAQDAARIRVDGHIDVAVRPLTHVANALARLGEQRFAAEQPALFVEREAVQRQARTARRRRCGPSTAGTCRRCRRSCPEMPIDGSHISIGSSIPSFVGCGLIERAVRARTRGRRTPRASRSSCRPAGCSARRRPAGRARSPRGAGLAGGIASPCGFRWP